MGEVFAREAGVQCVEELKKPYIAMHTILQQVSALVAPWGKPHGYGVRAWLLRSSPCGRASLRVWACCITLDNNDIYPRACLACSKQRKIRILPAGERRCHLGGWLC